MNVRFVTLIGYLIFLLPSVSKGQVTGSLFQGAQALSDKEIFEYDSSAFNKSPRGLSDYVNVNKKIFQIGVIHDSLDLSQKNFSESMILTRCSYGFFGCFRTVFQDTVVIKGCELSKSSYLMYSKFSLLDFSQGTYYDTLSIFNSIFSGTVYLNENIFVKDLVISQSSFNRYLTINNCKIGGEAVFNNCTFEENFEANATAFEGNVKFIKCKFEGDNDFDFAVFKGDISLINIRNLKNEINLTKSFISYYDAGYPEFQDSVPFRYIELTNSDVSKIIFDYNKFRLKFRPNATYEEKATIYQTLLNNYKRLGYNESFEIVDKEYKEFDFKYHGQYVLNFLNKIWWDYGYKKSYIYNWTFGSLLVFWIINFMIIKYLNSDVYQIKTIPASKSKSLSLLDRLYFSAIYTCFIFFSLHLKIDSLQFKNVKGKFAAIYILSIYVFGLFCLAYLVNYIISK